MSQIYRSHKRPLTEPDTFYCRILFEYHSWANPCELPQSCTGRASDTSHQKKKVLILSYPNFFFLPWTHMRRRFPFRCSPPSTTQLHVLHRFIFPILHDFNRQPSWVPAVA